MMDMLTLTTRMNALARITLGNVNIAATTALQVQARLGVWGWMAGAGAGAGQVQRRVGEFSLLLLFSPPTPAGH